MDPFEPQLDLKKEVRFSECFSETAVSSPEESFGDVFGGIFKSGQWGWLSKGSCLHITSLRTGQLISKFDFDDSNGFGVCIITCVSEIQLPYLTDTNIAIGIQYADCPGGIVVIYSVEESTVIRCIELKHKITCCKFISHEVLQHTALQNMNGCLTVGTDGGSVLLVDLNLQSDQAANVSTVESGVSIVPCHIVDYSMSLLHLHRHFQHCQQEGVHFGIQLEVLENAEFVQSLLPVNLILCLAVGLADGRLVLYDLTDMQVLYIAPPQERSSPLVKMSFMEPPDDPRPCVYIWAFHENYQNSMAVMHSLMYEKRVVAHDGFCYFENFQVSCVRLLLPLNCPKSVPIACQAITKVSSHGNDTISLCALVWKQDRECQTEVLLFDINQWYKEEMPYVGDWREDPSYLASFVINGLSSVEVYFNSNTISLFNSIQRPEEHFYPVSLSFDCIGLGENSCLHLNWPGAQNRVINVLRSKGSLLDPNPVFREILNTRLLPQFSGMNYKSTFSLKAKRETLLSVAIEQNCIGLLKECAKSWSDGSHQGKCLSEGLSMSTLTDWLWSRASSIKERCNNLCKVLFDHSGRTLDQREQKELGYISRQLKTLADLLNEIISKYREGIPSDVLSTLESQCISIQMASDYQEILLWLLNIGLLPEASRSTRHREVELNLVPYPYDSLRRFYENRRVEFTRLNEKFASRKTRSCYLLFIDSFIEHEFKGNNLRDSWQESGGDGLYPPTSIQAMLRTMLIPEVTFDNKCALFLYFFLDLNMAIEDKRYEPIVQNFIKFPSVFKLSASLIKQIQAFWNLDHCRFQAAVDEFISPFNRDQVCPQWQLELFLESLLAQNEANLALRVLEAKSSPISPVLQLNTYLANDLISEAFHFARSKQDEDLLKLFFSGCLCTGKFGVIRDLALTESEGNLVQSLLKNSKSRNAENLHFVYLLQKYKYIEAVSYLDELSKGRVVQRAVDVDTPTLVLSAYNTTMTPVTKGLSDVYFKIKNKIKSKESEQSSPYPLSCQLIKQNANDLLGGIYHSSALSAHFASHYWERHQSQGNTLQQSTNAPFLRRPQIRSSYSDYNQECISYPDPFKVAQKRRLDSSSVEEERSSKVRENPKKRRKVYDRTDMETIYKPLSSEQLTADNLLTHFRNTSKHSEDMTSFTRQFQKTPPRETSFFLQTPYVKNTIGEHSETVSRSQVAKKSGIVLQGILKGSHSNPKSLTEEADLVKTASIESEKRERKDTDEEKSIRFILPSSEDESEEQDIRMENEDIEEPLQEESSPSSPLRRHAGPSKRKSLRSCSSYTSTSSFESKSPLKKSLNLSYSRAMTKRNVPKIVIKEPGKQRSLSRSVSPLNVVGVRTALKSSSTEESTSVAIETTDNVVVTRSTTASSTSIGRAKAEETEGQLSLSRSVSPLNVVGVGSAFKSTSTEDAFSSARDPTDNIIVTRSITASRTSLERAKSEEPKEQPISVNISRMSPLKNVRNIQTEEQSTHTSSDSTVKERIIPISYTEEEQSTSRLSFSPRSVVRARTPLRSTNFQQSPTVAAASAVKSRRQSDDSGEYPPAKVSAIEKIVPVIVVDKSFCSQTQPKIVDEPKAPKRVYENSDDDTIESNSSIQRTVKQLKGRASIHSETRENKTELNIQTKSSLQPTESILKPDTTIDFKPHVSSSKVCATESKFYVDSTETLKDSEIESRFQSEKFTSKVKFSERSTVVGGLTSLPTLERSEIVTETVSVKVQSKNQMLDTTVDMTLYDTTGFEPSHQPESSENSTSREYAASNNRHIEDESTNSELNAFNDEPAKNVEDDDDSDSVILLSSRSSSLTFYEEDDSEYSESRPHQHEPAKQVVINVEEDDDDSDGIDILYRFSDDPEDESNSFSNKFSDVSVTRTSTSYSIPSNTDTVLSSAAEIEVETANRDVILKEGEHSSNAGSSKSPSKEAQLPEKLESEEKADSEKVPGETLVAETKESELVPSAASAKSIEQEISETEKNSGETLEIGLVSSAATEESIKQEISEPEVKEAACKHRTREEDGEEVESEGKRVKLSDEEQSLGANELTLSAAAAKENIEEKKGGSSVEIEQETKSDETTVQREEVEIKGEIAETIAQSEEIEVDSKIVDITAQSEEITSVSEDTAAQKEAMKIESKCEETVTQTEEIQETENEAEAMVATEKVDLHIESKEIKNKTLLEESVTEGHDDKREEQQIVEEDLTPNPQGKRSKSFSKTLNIETDAAATPRNRRDSRGGSMPPTPGSQIVTRRRSLLLESLEENTTPDSPSNRTRSKTRLDSIDGNADSPSVSKVKRTRLSSISSATSVEHPQTPKSRRRSSISSVDKELSNTPKAVVTPRGTRARSITAEVTTTPIKTPRRLSISKKDDSLSDETSPAGSSKTESPEVEISQSDDYKSSRRLTRTQLAVLEKSAALAKQFATSTARTPRRSESRTSGMSPPTAEPKGSDTESISSRTSHLSNSTTSRRITRSSALKGNIEDDMVSVASSTESGRKRRKRIKDATSPVAAALTVIPEEEPSGSEGSAANSETSKKSKRQRK